MMGLLIAAGVVALLAIMPVGVSVRYDTLGFLAKLLVGPVPVTVYPREKKKEKDKRAKKKKDIPNKDNKPGKQQTKKENRGSFSDFRGVITEAVSFLGAFRRKLVIKRLEMKLILAGDDPCDLACNYGKAWAALGNLMPLMERVFVIKKRDLDVSCDFCAEQIVFSAHLDVVISVGRLLWIVIYYGIRILREYLKLKNLKKGGNQL